MTRRIPERPMRNVKQDVTPRLDCLLRVYICILYFDIIIVGSPNAIFLCRRILSVRYALKNHRPKTRLSNMEITSVCFQQFSLTENAKFSYATHSNSGLAGAVFHSL